MHANFITRLVLAVLITMVVTGISTAMADENGQREFPTEPWFAEANAGELNQALELAGANRPEIEKALDFCMQKPMTMSAMQFLVVNLPLSDLGSVTGDELIENVTLAMDAWFEAPYGADVDPGTWAHYVLPIRVSQEPLTSWRGFFHAELKDLVAECTTLEEAAVAVNQWCGERVGFKQTQRRDQDPLSTLKSGYGRCEEMVIFYICACRSVGIPARQAYCPYWTWSDNNHAWVEVYGSDGRWHFTGGCEPRPTLDDAWFGGAVKRAPLVCSMSYGVPAEKGPDVMSVKEDVGARYTLINSISFYRETGTATFDVGVVQEGEKPYNIFVHVFNFGALRRIARIQLDADGTGEVELGAGIYIISTDAPVTEREAVLRIVPGRKQIIDWRIAPRPDPEMVLSYPQDPE